MLDVHEVTHIFFRQIAAEQNIRHTDDRIHRGTDLMGHIRYKGRLRLIGILCALLECLHDIRLCAHIFCIADLLCLILKQIGFAVVFIIFHQKTTGDLIESARMLVQGLVQQTVIQRLKHFFPL